jgi:hypothetical protein
VSDAVLDAVSRALRLNSTEHAYLHDLARPQRATGQGRQPIRRGVRRLLDSMHDAPAIVVDRPAPRRRVARRADRELHAESAQFRALWADHTVREKTQGLKRIHHPVVGELVLTYERLALADDDEQALIAYTAEPGSPTAERLAVLASWGTRRDAGRDDQESTVSARSGTSTASSPNP